VTQANAKELGMSDFYTSYMWNYCSGNVTSDNWWPIQRCTASKSGYTFNVEAIVDAEAKKKIEFPESVKKVQKAINLVQKFMAACYVLGAVATGGCFIVGWFGLLSRWGSCITTIIADVGSSTPYNLSHVINPRIGSLLLHPRRVNLQHRPQLHP